MLTLRKRGLTYKEIGQQMDCSEKIAWKIVSRELRRLNERRTADAEQLRQLESQRLDALLAGIWDKAAAGDLAAVGVALSIGARQAKLWGLDSAAKLEVCESPQRVIIEEVIVDHEIMRARRLAAASAAGQSCQTTLASDESPCTTNAVS